MINLKYLLISICIASICCICSCSKKDKDNSNTPTNIVINNGLPYHLPAMSGVPPEVQQKEITFYGNTDLIFKCSGTTRFTTNSTALSVEILNPAIEIFAIEYIDSLFKDTINYGGAQTLETHNRSNGINFYRTDTIPLATAFTSNELATKRPATPTDRLVSIHNKHKESYNGNTIPFDIEYGSLKNNNVTIIGFKNTTNNDVFFIEIEDRYTLNSIQLIQD